MHLIAPSTFGLEEESEAQVRDLIACVLVPEVRRTYHSHEGYLIEGRLESQLGHDWSHNDRVGHVQPIEKYNYPEPDF